MLQCQEQAPCGPKRLKELEKNLRDSVYNTMVNRSKNSTYNYYEYVRRGNND